MAHLTGEQRQRAGFRVEVFQGFSNVHFFPEALALFFCSLSAEAADAYIPSCHGHSHYAFLCWLEPGLWPVRYVGGNGRCPVGRGRDREKGVGDHYRERDLILLGCGKEEGIIGSADSKWLLWNVSSTV